MYKSQRQNNIIIFFLLLCVSFQYISFSHLHILIIDSIITIETPKKAKIVVLYFQIILRSFEREVEKRRKKKQTIETRRREADTHRRKRETRKERKEHCFTFSIYIVVIDCCYCACFVTYVKIETYNLGAHL